jgi:hypothetical protein
MDGGNEGNAGAIICPWKLSSMHNKIPALKRVRGLPYFNA